MTWRIYVCKECGDVLGVGENFPDDGRASHADKPGGTVHDDSSLLETPNTPPFAEGPEAVLLWAAEQIADEHAKELSHGNAD